MQFKHMGFVLALVGLTGSMVAGPLHNAVKSNNTTQVQRLVEVDKYEVNEVDAEAFLVE